MISYGDIIFSEDKKEKRICIGLREGAVVYSRCKYSPIDKSESLHPKMEFVTF